MRILPTLAAALAAAAVAAAPAAADSIVYAKQGNLFLTSPGGSKGYQLTFAGGYSEPSQADDGTIGALRYKQLVRLDRSGRPRNAPIDAMGTSRGAIGGPYEPRLSPDGKRFAYYFYVQTSFDDYANNIRWIDTGSYGTWTWADHFTSAATESEYAKLLTQAEWVSNDRLLGTMGFWMNMWTWKLGTGHGYTPGAAQWWFGLRDPMDDWGVEPYHWYSDPALSRDGTKLAMTDGEGNDSRLYLAATHGPAWSGEPPYPEPDYVGGASDLAPPTIECSTGQGMVQNPTWSSDGGSLAYASGDGVHVMSVPANLDCSKLSSRLLVPGASDPAFGPADVNPAQAPAPGAPAPAAAPAPASKPVAVSAVSLHPRTFRAAAGTRVRFTLSAPARVTLTVRRGTRVKASLAAAGKAGANDVRFRRRLAPGAYRLELRAGTVASTRFRIVR